MVYIRSINSTSYFGGVVTPVFAHSFLCGPWGWEGEPEARAHQPHWGATCRGTSR